MIDGVAWIVVLVQILCVDLLLGADNAVVIALACSRLPAEETRRAVVLGAVGAIALRLGMLAFANALLAVPLVKLIAAWTLVVIALNVRARKPGDERPAAAGAAGDFTTAALVTCFRKSASRSKISSPFVRRSALISLPRNISKIQRCLAAG